MRQLPLQGSKQNNPTGYGELPGTTLNHSIPEASLSHSMIAQRRSKDVPLPYTNPSRRDFQPWDQNGSTNSSSGGRNSGSSGKEVLADNRKSNGKSGWQMFPHNASQSQRHRDGKSRHEKPRRLPIKPGGKPTSYKLLDSIMEEMFDDSDPENTKLVIAERKGGGRRGQKNAEPGVHSKSVCLVKYSGIGGVVYYEQLHTAVAAELVKTRYCLFKNWLRDKDASRLRDNSRLSVKSCEEWSLTLTIWNLFRHLLTV